MHEQEQKEEWKPVPWTNGKNRIGGVIGWIKGIGFLLVLFITAYFGAVYLLAFSFPFLLFAPRVYRKFNDLLAAWWYHLPVFFVEYIFRVKFIFTGDKIEQTDRTSVFISNHRTRLDWLFLWTYFFHQGRLSNEKIILKYELKLAPGFGWAMQAFAFLFLRRKRELDNAHMHNLFGFFADTHYPVQFLLFPEGTDYCPRTVQRNFDFAKDKKMAIYRHVLHPRTGAISVAYEELSRSHFSSIYDITMGYPDVIPQGEKEIASGNFPHQIYVHVKRYDVSELPRDTTALTKWVQARWEEKEQRLTNFYEHNKVLDGDQQQTRDQASYPTQSIEGQKLFQTILAVAGWIVFICLVPWLITSYLGFYWFILTNLFYLVVTYFGGAEYFELRLHANQKQKRALIANQKQSKKHPE